MAAIAFTAEVWCSRTDTYDKRLPYRVDVASKEEAALAAIRQHCKRLGQPFDADLSSISNIGNTYRVGPWAAKVA
jgi:hypothetical protein